MRRRLPVGMAGSLLFAYAVVLVGIVYRTFGVPFLPMDRLGDVPYPRTPNVAIAVTARHLWKTGNLRPTLFGQIDEYLRRESAAHPDTIYRPDAYSVSVQGELLPKHPWLLAVMAAPFTGLMGNAGLWLLNQLLLYALFAFAYLFAREWTSPRAALWFCVLLVLGTRMVWFYSYTLSHDVLYAALLLGCAWLLPRRPLIGGLLAGAALSVRITTVLVVPFLALGAARERRHALRDLWPAVGSFAAVALVVLWINQHFFDAPLAGSYARQVTYVGGHVLLDSHFHGASLSYLAKDWLPRLTNLREGLIPCYPVLLLAPLGWVAIWRTSARRRWTALAAAGTTLLAFHLTYRWWIGAGGDRYVMFSVIALALPLSLSIERLLARPRTSRLVATRPESGG